MTKCGRILLRTLSRVVSNVCSCFLFFQKWYALIWNKSTQSLPTRAWRPREVMSSSSSSPTLMSTSPLPPIISPNGMAHFRFCCNRRSQTTTSNFIEIGLPVTASVGSSSDDVPRQQKSDVCRHQRVDDGVKVVSSSSALPRPNEDGDVARELTMKQLLIYVQQRKNIFACHDHYCRLRALFDNSQRVAANFDAELFRSYLREYFVYARRCHRDTKGVIISFECDRLFNRICNMLEKTSILSSTFERRLPNFSSLKTFNDDKSVKDSIVHRVSDDYCVTQLLNPVQLSSSRNNSSWV